MIHSSCCTACAAVMLPCLVGFFYGHRPWRNNWLPGTKSWKGHTRSGMRSSSNLQTFLPPRPRLRGAQTQHILLARTAPPCSTMPPCCELDSHGAIGCCGMRACVCVLLLSRVRALESDLDSLRSELEHKAGLLTATIQSKEQLAEEMALYLKQAEGLR